MAEKTLKTFKRALVKQKGKKKVVKRKIQRVIKRAVKGKVNKRSA